MHKRLTLIAALLIPGALAVAGQIELPEAEARSRESFNSDWRFARFGKMPDGTTREEPASLEGVDLEDGSWRPLNLPHDWGIEGPFRQELAGSTGKLPWAGIGWYRKHFTVASTDKGKRIFLDIDGAMADSTVWLNGKKLGGWPYGYSSYRIELTDSVKYGQKNVIAVRLDNKENSSRWYPGGGIYRNVWLVKTHPLHVGHWGTFVTTPEVSAKSAVVKIEVTVDNQSESTANAEISGDLYFLGKGGLSKPAKVGAIAAEKLTVNTNGSAKTTLSVTVNNPKCWDLKNPELYCVRVKVVKDGQVVDTYQTTFGIRNIAYVADKGFLLNGNVVEIKGVCQHHDLGPLGSAINTRALERQIEILQEMGCNSIRTSHNPPAPELLDLCDRMGMLVQVEAFDCWSQGKTANDYSRFFERWHKADLVAMVHRDRNHPSVIMWSSGNEVKEQHNPSGYGRSRQLTDIIKAEDPTRPVTVGSDNPNAAFTGFEKTVDIFGFNYKPHLYGKFITSNPNQPLYGSETASCISSRGEYFFPVSDDKSKGQGGPFHVSSYDLAAPYWANCPDVEFAAQDTYSQVLGEFVWTGFDYLGEPTPYNDPAGKGRKKRPQGPSTIPARSSYFGILDLCGFKKDRFYIYQARWRNDLPMVHILPHWNWPERVGQVTPVHVYTSGDEVELFLNGTSLGRQKREALKYRFRWDTVTYAPGVLKAVAYKNGNVWAETVVRTTGEAAGLTATADRKTISADGSDLSFVTIQVTDDKGDMVPRANMPVTYSIEGPGEIIAVDNGDPTSHESFQATTRRVFNGMALVVIRSLEGRPGTVKLKASSAGLREATALIQTEHGVKN